MTSPFENTIYNFTSPQGILRDHLRSSLLAYQTQSMLGRFNGGSSSFRRPRPRSHPKEVMSLLETYTHGPPTYPSYLEDTIYALLVEEQYKHYCRKYGTVNRNSKIVFNNDHNNNNNSNNNNSDNDNDSKNVIKPSTSRLHVHGPESLTNNTSQLYTSNNRNSNNRNSNNRNTNSSMIARMHTRHGSRIRDNVSRSSSSSSSSSASSSTARSAFFDELDAVDKAASPELSATDASHMSCSSPLYFSASGSSSRYNSYLTRLEQEDLRLPTAWSSTERGVSLDLGENDNEITYKGTGIEGDASSVRSNYWVKPQCGLFYYEVKIEANDEDSDGHISIGFCDEYSRLDHLPGSDDYSWGYHGENGFLTGGRSSLSNNSSSNSRKYGACFGIGDTIGCGIDFNDKTIFYTRNGIHLGTAFRDVSGKRMYPTIGFKTSGEKVTANFGQHSSFIFDIHQYRKEVADRVLHHVISSTPLPTTAPLSNDMEDHQQQQQQQKRPRKKTTPMDHLVVNYLNHAGYMDTFTAMKKEMDDGMDEHDQARREKVKMRQDICMALRNGQIDQVFIKCEQHYPDMLSGYPRLLFRLQCQKFMALVEAVMPQQKSVVHLGKQHQQQAGGKRTRSVLEMDDDNNTTAYANADNDNDDEDEVDGYYWQDLQTVMDYGQYLQQTYGSSNNKMTATTMKMPSETSIRQIMDCDITNEQGSGGGGGGMKKTLADIDVASELKATFSILAYVQPSDNPNAYLCGPRWREGIASDLNAAMLVTEGEHPESSLERLYRQTSVTMHELVLSGNGQASMVPIMDSLL